MEIDKVKQAANTFFSTKTKHGGRYNVTYGKQFIFNSIKKILTRNLLKQHNKKGLKKKEAEKFFFDYYFSSQAEYSVDSKSLDSFSGEL